MIKEFSQKDKIRSMVYDHTGDEILKVSFLREELEHTLSNETARMLQKKHREQNLFERSVPPEVLKVIDHENKHYDSLVQMVIKDCLLHLSFLMSIKDNTDDDFIVQFKRLFPINVEYLSRKLKTNDIIFESLPVNCKQVTQVTQMINLRSPK